MEDLKLLEVPLFSGLHRIDLAKLIPELERVSYQPGEILFYPGTSGDSLFVVVNGKARVFLGGQNEGMKEIGIIGPKECFGEMAMLTGESRSAGIQAITELSVLKLSKDRFDNLINKHHSLAVYFAGTLAKRLASANSDLKYYKELLGAKEKEEKISSLPAPPTQVAGVSPIHPKPQSSRQAQSVFNRNVLGVILVILFCSAIFFLRPTGIHRLQLILLELLLAATILWSLNLFSYHVVALALPVLAVLFGTTTAEKAFSGFSNPAWFLVLGVFAISAAISKTGLLYRLVLLVVRHFPPNYMGKTMALAFSGLVLTPIIPSSLGRAARVPLVWPCAASWALDTCPLCS